MLTKPQYSYPKFQLTDEQKLADAAARRDVAVGDELLVEDGDYFMCYDAYLVNVTRVAPTQFLTVPVGTKHGEQRWLRKSGRLHASSGWSRSSVHALTPEAREFWRLFQAEYQRRQTVERIRSFAWELGPVQAEVLKRLQVTLLHGDLALDYLETLVMLQDALGREVAKERGKLAEEA